MSVLLLCKMNENLRERKLNFLNYLNHEYALKPLKWWHPREEQFRTTWSVASESRIKQLTGEEVILKRHLKEAIISIASFFLVMVVCNTFENGVSEKMVAGIFAVILLGMFAYALAAVGDRKPVMIINESGIWVETITFYILWEDIVSTYIEYVSSGDDVSHKLLIYYYDKDADDFRKIAYSVSGIGMQVYDIAFHIESWKINSGYPSPEY
jgi:hypothetical protein